MAVLNQDKIKEIRRSPGKTLDAKNLIDTLDDYRIRAVQRLIDQLEWLTGEYVPDAEELSNYKRALISELDDEE